MIKTSCKVKAKDFFKISSILLVVLLLTNNRTFAQDDLKVILGESSNNEWFQFRDNKNSLYHHLSNQAYELLEKRVKKISEINTLADWQERQREVKRILTQNIGPFPEKTPLNANIIKTIKKEGYKVEHIVYESQPNYFVTSSLFIPNQVEIPAPTIIFASGHSQAGYRSSTYQHIILNFVKKGFIVFAFDPIGQGERFEYYDPEEKKSVVGRTTREHSYSGVQANITGSSQVRYMVWEGIRAVDYLLTRKEVDSNRIGITGRSGGGTQSAFIAALDDRIYASAPGAYITNYTRLLQSIGPQDAEQNIFHGISLGIDHADLLAVRAPKPSLVISTTEDMFSIQGARETVKEVTKIYKAYNKADHFGMVEDRGEHESTYKNREALYAFFQNHLNLPGNSTDEQTELLTNKEIQVTSTGQVLSSYDSETVFSLNRRIAEQKVLELQSSRENLNNHLVNVIQKAKNLSGYQEPEEIEDPVYTGSIKRSGYIIKKFFVKGEGDYVIPYLLFIPDEATNKKILIYLHPSGKSAEASSAGEIEWLVKRGITVFAPDLLGVGEMGPGDLVNYVTKVKDFETTSFDVWPASVLIGRSIVGIQAGDIVRLVKLLKKNSDTEELYGFAEGDMAPALLHATAFDTTISRIALYKPYSSYRLIVMNRYYDPNFHKSTVAGSLGKYDLPDLAASLAPRKLLITGITDGTGNSQNQKIIDEDLSVIKRAYQLRNAENELLIASMTANGNLYDLLKDWIK